MIYHSIIPYEIVMQGADKMNNEYITKIVQYRGRQVEVETSSNGSTAIRRILGTSLKDYLDPELQPGMNIEIWH